MSSAAPSRVARVGHTRRDPPKHVSLRPKAFLAETVRYGVPDLGKMHRLLLEPFEFKKPAKSISLYARVFVVAHAAFRAAHLAHLVSPGARPSYPVLWDADKQCCFAFEPTSQPHEDDYSEFQPEIFPWENGLKLMPCEWRHHLHVRLPSRGFDRWRGDPRVEPDQLHQWATSAPTVQGMSSMSRLSRNAGAVTVSYTHLTLPTNREV